MIRIEVLGIPRPGGSKTPGITKSGKAYVRPANPNTAIWRAEVAAAATEQYSGPLMSGPIEMTYEFRFPRPKKHYLIRKNVAILRPNAPRWHVNVPDLTKIIRSTEDALKYIVLKDDCFVCKRFEMKRYCYRGERPGVTLTLKGIQ